MKKMNRMMYRINENVEQVRETTTLCQIESI